VQWIHDHARNSDSRIDLGSRSSRTTKPLLYQLGIRQLRYLWPIRADEKVTAFVELERRLTNSMSAAGAITATLLSYGTVLVAGGGARSSLAEAEIYDSATGTWTSQAASILLGPPHGDVALRWHGAGRSR
jgi:hypothetical protein